MNSFMVSMIFAMASFCPSEDVVVVDNGQTDYVIAVKSDATKSEKFASKELSEFLTKTTRAKFLIINEKELKTAQKAIYVGKTDFARKHGVDFDKLGQEDWAIKMNSDGNLILAGGHPRGTLYAVYEFLNANMNCRFLDEETSILPAINTLTVSIGERSGKPAFRTRQIYDTLDWYDKSVLFKIRNKGFAFAPEERGGYFHIGSPREYHTYYSYSKDWPQDEVDLYTLNEKGERLIAKDATGPGQICMTNPKARTRVLNQMLAFIKSDRENCDKSGMPYPLIYDISPNDNDSKCMCGSCKTLAAKYGNNYGAPLIDFTNYIAGNIAKKYPDLYIRTFAYLYALNPVSELRPAKNVIIQLAPMGVEFAQDRDTTKSLNSPVNEKTKALLTKWSNTANNLAIWDYWILYATDYQSPNTLINALPENIKFYRDNKVIDIFAEAEFPDQQSFFGLKRYVGYRLMDNPDINFEKLLDEFFAGMYGKAAPVMREYFDYLSNRQNVSGKAFAHLDSSRWGYLDQEFYEKSFALLNKALSLVDDEKIKMAINRERIPILASLLYNFSVLNAGTWGYDKKTLYNDYKKYSTMALEYYYPNDGVKANQFKELNNRLRLLVGAGLSAPVPKEFAGFKTIVLEWPHLRWWGDHLDLVDDPNAVLGKAGKIGALKSEKDYHKKGLLLGAYSVKDFKDLIEPVKIEPAKLPKDELYHWYSIGNVTLDRFTYLFIHHSRLLQFWFRQYYNPQGSKEDNTYEIFISVKLQGPSYSPNSAKEDAVLVDRAILVKKT